MTEQINGFGKGVLTKFILAGLRKTTTNLI
jgi:hypothetical protein